MLLWDVYCVDDSSRLWLLGDVVDEMTRTLSCRGIFKVFVKQTQMHAQKRTHKHMHAWAKESQIQRSTSVCMNVTEILQTNKRASESEGMNSTQKVGNVCMVSAPVVCLRRRRNFHFRKDFPRISNIVWPCESMSSSASLLLCAVHMQHECVHNWGDWCQCISFFSRSNMSSINFLFHLLAEIRIRVV